MLPSDVSAKRFLTEGVESVRARIAARAYDLYLERGGGEDRALDDWLRAESEVLAPEVMALARSKSRRVLDAGLGKEEVAAVRGPREAMLAR